MLFVKCHFLPLLVKSFPTIYLLCYSSLQVDKAAAGLLALGLKRGDRLGVWGPNTYEWILFQFASAKAGIILVSLGFVLYRLQSSLVFAVTVLQLDD